MAFDKIREIIVEQLKVDINFTVTDVRLHLTSNVFILVSVLSQWRRELTDGLLMH